MKRPRGEPRTRYLSGGGSHAGLLVAVVAIIVVTVGAYWAGRWRASTGRARADAPAMDAGFVGLEPREIDLGDQLWGQSIPIEFLFVNESRLPVSIGSIESSCGCLVIDSDAWNGRVVQPGELVSMDVMLDTENNPGAKVRRLDLTLDSGERYSARIVVNVYGTWSVAPVSMVAGLVAPEAVSPFMPGSVSVTWASTKEGMSTLTALPRQNSTSTWAFSSR